MSDATITLSPTENVIKSDTQVDGHDPSMLISMRNIWKTYQMGTEKVHALHGVSFDIPRGEYIAIIGPSGSGKSTLMNLIGCLEDRKSTRLNSSHSQISYAVFCLKKKKKKK